MIQEILTKPSANTSELNAPALHVLASAEKDRHAAKRIRAMAYFAEGKSSLDVAVRVKADAGAVLRWRRIFLTGGLDGLRTPRTGARCRLTLSQRETLAAIVTADPSLSWLQVCAIVKKRFKVSYTEAGMYRLVTQTLKLRI